MTDLKFAIRQLLKRPAGTVVILLTLSLVIGTMSLVLGVIQHEQNAWMPFPEPDEVVRLWQHTENGPRDHLPCAFYSDSAEHLEGLESMGVLGVFGSQVWAGEGDPRSLSIQYVSPSVFAIMRVPPLLGRVFTGDEARSGTEHLLVISHASWQSDFGGREDIVGTTLALNDRPVEVIGVMPPGLADNGVFYGIDGWLPRDFTSPAHANSYGKLIGRRAAGVSAAQLNAELATVMPPLFDAYLRERDDRDEAPTVTALRADKRPGLRLRADQLFFLAIPVFTLGIAAFNIANILLGRMLARKHEFAVRFSLGARRGRLIRQLLTESLALSLAGGLAGIMVAYWVARWAEARQIHAEFSPLVLLATLAFAALAGLVVGWLPAWRATRGDLVTDLKEVGGGGSSGGITRHRLRNFLAAGQVAMAAAICLSAGLLLRSHHEKRNFEPAFDPAHMASFHTTLNREMYPEPEARALYAEQVREQLLAVAGVTDVSHTSDRVVSRHPFPTGFRLEGQDAPVRGQMVNLSVASPNHLEMVNNPVVRGRPLLESDRRGSPLVTVVNRSFVRRYFPDRDPVGARIQLPLERGQQWAVIVGVVADRVNLGYEEDLGPEAWFSALQVSPEWASPVFLVKTGPEPSALGGAIREAARSVDAKVPVGDVVPVNAEIERAVNRNMNGTRAISLIAAFGLLMAMIGIYGVISCSVVERTYELGVRMALGANRSDVLRLVMRQGMRYAVIGLAAGLILGGVISAGMRNMLFGIGQLDPSTYAGVCALLLVTALGACWLPARRAARTNPMQALRSE